ncbi:hypothetical protein K491DRAFT_782439 [Lophiostoma macrostomum CBS 122681]|uniref:Uncharacterized protein n=1 Tax=Lophiostoma macrostomum CBS 122681 TaxID=1314788 RepID=A0A6A6SSN2_9PLEO|nr:hypothetical protein K491DRAFT_782439 [Lophiostoma macrostomum CBS 122681]
MDSLIPSPPVLSDDEIYALSKKESDVQNIPWTSGLAGLRCITLLLDPHTDLAKRPTIQGLLERTKTFAKAACPSPEPERTFLSLLRCHGSAISTQDSQGRCDHGMPGVAYEIDKINLVIVFEDDGDKPHRASICLQSLAKGEIVIEFSPPDIIRGHGKTMSQHGECDACRIRVIGDGLSHSSLHLPGWLLEPFYHRATCTDLTAVIQKMRGYESDFDAHTSPKTRDILLFLLVATRITARSQEVVGALMRYGQLVPWTEERAQGLGPDSRCSLETDIEKEVIGGAIICECFVYRDIHEIKKKLQQKHPKIVEIIARQRLGNQAWFEKFESSVPNTPFFEVIEG